MDDQAFLAAIIAAPDDDAPRLVYADWLDDHGQPERAEFIRVQCDLARRGKYDPDRPALEARERVLAGEYAEAWAEPVAAITKDYKFHRGFMHAVSVGVRKLLTHGDALFAAAPVQHVRPLRLGTANATAADLAKSPHLPRIRGLTFSGHLGPDDLCTLIRAPGLKQLTHLTVEQSLGGNDVYYLVNGTLPHLATLRLSSEAAVVTTSDVEFLTKARWANGLRDLELRYQPVNVRGVEFIARTKRFKKLRRLVLFDCGVGLAGTKALADSPNLPNLTTLDLRGNRLTDSAATAIAAAKGFPALTELYLGMNQIGPAGAKALAEWPGLARLRLLHLYSNPIGDDGVCALAASPHAANLRYLDVTHTGLGDRGHRALAESPYLEGTRLDGYHTWPEDRLF